MVNAVSRALRTSGDTGEILLRMLESRLDNIVYRLGLAQTRPAARQLFTHRHIMVNGTSLNIPSYLLSPGDTIKPHPDSKALPEIKESLKKSGSRQLPPYLSLNAAAAEGTLAAASLRSQIPEDIAEDLVIEYYSR